MAFPSYSELEGKTWHQLSDALREQILTEFGYSEPSMNPVLSFTPEQRVWLDSAALDVTGRENEITLINEGRSTQVGFMLTIDNKSVTSVYALTDPENYLPYYHILHTAPFLHVTEASFPQPSIV